MADTAPKNTEEVPAAQPQYQPAQYQQQYAPKPPKQAKYPTLELSLAVFSIVAAVWLWVDALTASIGLFGNRSVSVDSITGMAFSHLSSFTAVMIVSIGAAAFAGLAFWLFARTKNAVADGAHTFALHAGIAIAGIKTLLLAIATVAVGLTPLLTLREGAEVGPVYLYDFLPLVLGTAAFAGLTWYLLKLVSGRQVGVLLGAIGLIAAGLVLVLAIVAVAVKSHDDKYTGTGASSSLQKSLEEWNDDSSSSSTDKKDTTEKKTDKKSSSDLTCSEAVSEYIDGSIGMEEYRAACKY